MSETVETAQATVQETPDLQALAALVFNEPLPQSTTQQTTEQEGAPASTTTTQEEAATAAAATQAATQDDVIDANEYLKQQLGYDNWESAKADLQALKELKEKAQTPAEIKFANDEAKRWFEYFKEGKEDELYQSLSGRQMLKNIDGMNEEQKLKLYIKMQNPLFDQELIDYTFDNSYKLNEEDFVDDPMKLRFEKVSRMQKMQNDLRAAGDYFAQHRTKVELPEIQKQQQQAIVDEQYEAYKASTAKDLDLYNNVIKPSFASLKETDLQMNIAVNDPNNQMQFEVGVAVDPQDFKTALNYALDFNGYLDKVSTDATGKFSPQRVARMILLEQNFDKYAQTLARQAVNAERKRVIEKEGAGGQTIQRSYNLAEDKTELQKQADLAFAV